MRSSVSSAASGNGALGQLHIEAVLDEPGRVYHGPEDPVHGAVVVKYIAPARTGSYQLFGPLNVDVHFTGQARINHDDAPAQVTPLFNKIHKVHGGPFRADGESEHRFPFTLHFPENADPSTRTTMTQEDNGSWNFTQSIGTDINVLPPSLDSQARDTTSVSKLKSVTRTLVGVRYFVSVRANMPGIDVDLVLANYNEGETVLYDRPKVPMMIASNMADSTEFSRQLTVQNEGLRSSEERPHGFMSKTKALLKSSELPKYVFTATCSGVAQQMFVGQPVAFDISIAPHFSSTVKVEPQVFLDYCTASLIARTSGCKPANIETKWSKTIDGDQKPYSDQHGWCRTIDIGELTRVPSTFSFSDIERTYKLRIAFQFSVGKQKLNVRQDMTVVIHPPVDEENENTLARVTSEGSALPSYGEAAATSMTPSYEDATGQSQPSYEQAIGVEDPYQDPTADLIRSQTTLRNGPDLPSVIHA